MKAGFPPIVDFRITLCMALVLPALVQSQVAAGILGGILGGAVMPLYALQPQSDGFRKRWLLDSAFIRPELFRKVALAAGYREIEGDSAQPCFGMKSRGFFQAKACFAIGSQMVIRDTVVHNPGPFPMETLPVTGGLVIGQLQINTWANDNPGQPLANWFMAAYLQELMPDRFKASDNRFVALTPKSMMGYRWRNTLSMGWGTQYGCQDNPFVSQCGLAMGFAYLLDAFHGFLLVGGPIIGERGEDKITIPIIGLISAIFWRGLLFHSGQFKASFGPMNTPYLMPLPEN